MSNLDKLVISDFSENCFLISRSNHAKFSETTKYFLYLSEYLRKTINWINVIPGEQAISVKFNSLEIFADEAKKILEEKITQFRFFEIEEDKPLIDIPVYYSEEFGLDIKDVAKKYSYSYQEIANLHSETSYEVKMIGFTPGFAYLGDLSEKLHMSRLSKPRTNLLPGSVGISGNRTAVYPLGGPGGWRIIGRTPKSLFDPNKKDPFEIYIGMRIKFESITKYEYENFSDKKSNEY